MESIVRRTSLVTPRGFAIRPWWAYDNDVTDRTQLSAYGLRYLSFFLCNKYDEHGAHIAFGFNPNPQAWSEGDRPLRDEHGDGLYTERARSETLFGATATYGHIDEVNTEGLFVLFTRGGESPTIPVTREEYLRATIFTLEGKDQAKLKELAAFLKKTQYDRWLEGSAERKKSHEQMIAGVASVDPAQATKFRAEFEKADREAEATLKKHDAAERAELDKTLAQLTVPGDRLRAQIAAMSPQERASPAFTHGIELAPAASPNATAIVRVNPTFYRARQSPLEPRALLVRMPNAYTELKEQHLQLYRELDWVAVKRLVNP